MYTKTDFIHIFLGLGLLYSYVLILNHISFGSQFWCIYYFYSENYHYSMLS